MVLQDYRFVVTQGTTDAIAFVGVEHHTCEVIKKGVVFIKGTRILSQGVQ